MPRPVALLMLVGLLVGARSAPGQVDPATAAALDAGYDRFVAAYAAADPDLVAAVYTEDALYLAPERDVVRGRAAIREIFAAFLDPFRERGEPGPVVAFEIVDRAVSGDLAYDVGYYILGREGSERRSRGKFVVVWKRGADGAWRIHADGYSGVPDPAPPDSGE